jgi:acyl transferase domain-containing protein/NADPH:quinone reductase-like Zn-dependent oxidoreductase/acyl carrier protein
MRNAQGSIREPVAITGIGCRLPGGVNGPRSLWRLLIEGVDAISPVPPDRWDADRYYSPRAQQAGRMNTAEGGFLDQADGFDAAFFGIPDRVAEQMDPQQRLLLEVCWETFEDAGIPAERLAGGRTGVFVGACSQDYGGLQSSPGEIEGIGPHSATGTFMSILSNRLSYTFDLRGPSVTLDTACSSSLVAVHLACASLRRGESDIAVAGGVNVMLTPQFSVVLSQAAMLSPDARCRAFDASADGYVRGEGAGVVLLKPLSRARLDGDRIYAVIRGTAINQDGRTQGITVPNGPAQAANFRESLADAGVVPADVGFVEAHGTGTPVGDPIEANALGQVLAVGRDPGQVAYLGSIKTNIGHLEAGAGIAGLIKAALSVYHRQIPASLHFQVPSPGIDFTGLGLRVPTTTIPWPQGYPRAIASVNSFGFGGTNANVVLDEPPERQAGTDAPATASTPGALILSARSEQALSLVATAHAERLESHPASLEQLGANLALRRSHHAHRLMVVAADGADAAAKLRAFVAGQTAEGVISGHARGGGGRVAFLFNGQGPQWYAMGRTLLETSTVFSGKIMECDRAARAYIDWSIYEALTAPDAETSRVQETRCLQPTMFALQVALAELWRSWGITPDGVTGHSMGEIAAGYTSGALSLDAALHVICDRARIQEKADPAGGMMFVAMSGDEARQRCEQRPDELWVSAQNSPRASTLSGRREALEALHSELETEGVFARMLRVNCACHSPDMDPLRDDLLAELKGVQGTSSAIPMYSTVTGELVEGTGLATGYWWQNFRRPVLFESAIRSMLADGFDTFIELSPHPVLANSLNEILADTAGDCLAVSSLVRHRDDWMSFLTALGALYTTGRNVAWHRRYPAGAQAMDLPANPWIRRRFWNESQISRRYRTEAQPHPMLHRVDAVRPAWEIKWDDHRLAWVREHHVLGSVIVPGAAYVESALVAARDLAGEPCALEFVEFERTCALGDEPVMSRLEIDPDDGTFGFYSRAVRGDTWVRNVRGRFYPAPDEDGAAAGFDLEGIRSRCAISHQAMDIYARMRQRGYAYGPAFCGIDRLHTGEGEALARVRIPRVLRNRMPGYLFHPAVLDACFQSAIMHPASGGAGDLLPYTYLPTGIDRIRLHGETVAPAWCYTRLRQLDGTGLTADIYVLDSSGRLIAEFTPLRGKVVPQTAADTPDRIDDHFYRLAWRPDRGGSVPRSTAITLGPSHLRAELEPQFRALTRRLRRHKYATDYQADLRRLCAAYMAECLRAFGLELAAGQVFSAADVTRVLPNYKRAFAGFLHFLVEDGTLSERSGEFRVEHAPAADPGRLWAQALARHPECIWELLLLRRTGTCLSDILAGDADPLAQAFPEGSQAQTEPIYQSSPIARYYNALVKRAVDCLVRTSDPRRTIRVLEVGGGTGGLTVNVLPVLPADRCQYVFTDVSPVFTRTARERFAHYDFVEYRTLDLDSDPEDQGIVPGSFDLILASDVLHATADLRKTLLYLQDALAPGGLLAVIEAVPGSRWLDLTFGLTDGWWSFRDLQLRPGGPLLPPSRWEDLLRSADYDDVSTLADPDHEGPGAQSVLLARAPAAVAAADDHQPAPSGGEPGRLGDWVIFAGSDGLGQDLARRIESRGGRAVLVHLAAEYGGGTVRGNTVQAGRAEDYEQLLAGLEPEGIVHLCDTVGSGADGPAIERAGRRAILSLASVVQALDRKASGAWPRLYVLTRGAHAFRNDTVRLEGAPLWGMGVVAGLELPQVRYTMIDLDSEPAPGDLDAVWAQLWRDDHEREVVLRGGERFVRRLIHVPGSEINAPVNAGSLPPEAGFALATTTPGSLDGLRYHAVQRAAPAAGQVEVEVVAAGLNFLDVMSALGQVPPLAGASDQRFGAECSGIVSRVGEGVTGLRPGDAVIAVSSAQGTLASHITLDAVCVVPKPEELGFEEAATVPIVFLTAWFALHKLARLQAGERVLIHSAAGGTGLAAIQIAQSAGAEIFATAGSGEKRALLRSLGIRQVMDSRSLAFADQVRAATDGQGIDVVLNAIAGESATRSITCLAPYGRFVEIGKRSQLADRNLSLRPFLQNLAYFSFDLRQMLADRPQLVRAELDRLLPLMAAGELRPLPYRVFHPAEAETALRHLSASRHIGKLVVAMDEPEVRVVHTAEPLPVTPGGTWLITGGLGGVGLAMADALAAAGASHLVLAGRSGAGEQARSHVENLRARGVVVLAEAVDVTSRAQLRQLLDRVSRELPPLRGVLHCAMVLDDALLTDLDGGRLANVIRPKVLGAWYLHELTRHLPLDGFVLFSSATSMIGNVGQANYGAANTFLDHLAAARRAGGQRALSVNLGAVSDAGYVARQPDIAQLVAATGMRTLTTQQLFRALRMLGNASYPQIGVLPMDWARFARHHALDRETWPRYEEIMAARVDGAQGSGDLPAGGSLREQLRSRSGDARGELIKAALKARVATVLGIPLDELNEDMPLMDYLDSLLAVEISAWLERELGAKVTILELMKGPSVAELTARLLIQLDGNPPAALWRCD